MVIWKPKIWSGKRGIHGQVSVENGALCKFYESLLYSNKVQMFTFPRGTTYRRQGPRDKVAYYRRIPQVSGFLSCGEKKNKQIPRARPWRMCGIWMVDHRWSCLTVRYSHWMQRAHTIKHVISISWIKSQNCSVSCTFYLPPPFSATLDSAFI